MKWSAAEWSGVKWSGVEWSGVVGAGAGRSVGGAIFQIWGVTGNSMVSNTNSLRNHPIWAPEPGGSILEVPGRWCESDL